MTWPRELNIHEHFPYDRSNNGVNFHAIFFRIFSKKNCNLYAFRVQVFKSFYNIGKEQIFLVQNIHLVTLKSYTLRRASSIYSPFLSWFHDFSCIEISLMFLLVPILLLNKCCVMEIIEYQRSIGDLNWWMEACVNKRCCASGEKYRQRAMINGR